MGDSPSFSSKDRRFEKSVAFLISEPEDAHGVGLVQKTK
jgi:hypothetical protein